MSKYIKCLSAREDAKYDRLAKRARSWFKENIKFRHKQFYVSKMLLAISSHSKTVRKVRLKANGNTLITVKEHLWMLREGNALYKFLDEYLKNEERDEND